MPKNADFFSKKNADISKITGAFVLKLYFLKLNMGVYLRTKFEVYRIVLTSFRQGGSFTSFPTPQKRTPKKPTQIRVKLLPDVYFGN